MPEGDEMNNKKIKVIEYIASYVILGTAVLFIFNFILDLEYIPTASMENTIYTGDVVIGTKINTNSINRFDIIVFDAPDEPGTNYIKRVIGLPGDTVIVKNGSVYVNGTALDEPYLWEMMDSSGDGTYVVPDNSYFVMGDNRNNSLDSRFWVNTFVPDDSVISKIFADITLSHFSLL